MEVKYPKTSLFIILSINILLTSLSLSQTVLPEAVKMDLKRVEETWKILDTYSEQIWPEWKNCSEVPFRIDYPNGLSIQIGETRKRGKYKLVDGITLRGKNIYLDDSRLNSLAITPHLFLTGGGAGGGAGKKFEMAIRRGLITPETEKQADSLLKNLGNSHWPKEIVYSTDQTIVILSHELFHCFTNFAAAFSTDDTVFISDLNYAVFAEIEGTLLEKAAFESDPSKVKQYLKESLIARQIKRRSMSARQQEFESDQEKGEGTATYAAYRLVELLQRGYEPGLSHTEDPLYLGFRYCDYFPAMNLKKYHEYNENPVDVNGRNYANGFYKCLILDKLLPAWKNKFFENKTAFEQLISQLVSVTEEEYPALLDAMKKEYEYEKLIQKNSPVIAERDSIIKYFENPGMTYFVINIKEMAIVPIPHITSSGTHYPVRFKSYYSSGATKSEIGDMTCESKGIPVCYDIMKHSILLPDGDSRKYELKYSKLEADSSYTNVTVATKNFILHAAKLRIVENPTQVEFKLLPLAK